MFSFKKSFQIFKQAKIFDLISNQVLLVQLLTMKRLDRVHHPIHLRTQQQNAAHLVMMTMTVNLSTSAVIMTVKEALKHVYHSSLLTHLVRLLHLPCNQVVDSYLFIINHRTRFFNKFKSVFILFFFPFQPRKPLYVSHIS